MKYFKNTELAKLYNISEKSVRNWIGAAEQGKIELELYGDGERQYIINSSKNVEVIEELVNKGKKYKNSRGYKVIAPTEDFYRLYGPKAIFDIISNLDIYREIPLQYSYFDGGAKIWDDYVQGMAAEKTANILSNTSELIELNMPYLEQLLEGTDGINVVDIGPFSCYPVRNLLQMLVDAGLLHRYICIDISPDMLRIAERNIREWFGDKVEFEGHVRDITYQRFDDLVAPDSFSKDENIRNLVLFLGGTVSNFREPHQPIETIHNSMGKNDLLLFSKQLDTPRARRHFDYPTDQDKPGTYVLPTKSRFTVELLNIDRSLYDIELFFDEQKMARRLQICLKVALSIEFMLNGKPRVINFNKAERILLWRHNHQNTFQTLVQFDTNGFDLIKAIKSSDGECLFSVFNIKTDIAN